MKRFLSVCLCIYLLVQGTLALGATSASIFGLQVDVNSSSEEIAALQEALICVGMLPQGSANGVYDATTIIAVAQFQEWVNSELGQKNLLISGMADAQTCSYLTLAKNTGMTPKTTTRNAIIVESSSNVVGNSDGFLLQTATPTPAPTAAPTFIPEPTKEAAVEFRDSVIENAVREHLDIWNRDLTSSDLQKVTSLHIADSSIKDTSDLKYCTNIEYLELVNCGLTSVPDLKGLQYLKEVDLSGNFIRTIQQFYHYQALEYLNLRENPLHNISGLSVLGDDVYLDLADFNSDKSSVWDDEVRQVQALLIEKNYLYDNADGRYGSKTAAAIRQLQADAMIEQTGGINQETLRALINLPARSFEPAKTRHVVIYNAYRDLEGNIYFRIKNTGKEAIIGVTISGQQLDGNLSPLGYIDGKQSGSTRYCSYNWDWGESVLESGNAKYCLLKNKDDFKLLHNVEYGRMWCYHTLDKSGNKVYHYDDSAAPKSTIVFPFFS